MGKYYNSLDNLDESILNKLNIQNQNTNTIVNKTQEDKSINEISMQPKTETKMQNQSNESKIPNTFKEKDAIDIFERLNQITFLLIDLNKRISAIEKHLSNKTFDETSNYAIEAMTKNVDKELQQFREEFKNKNTEKEEQIPTIPGTNKPNLSAIFPNAPKEAIAAAYKQMIEEQD